MASNFRVDNLENTGSISIAAGNLIITGGIEATGDISLLANSYLRFNNPGQNDQFIAGNNATITLDSDDGVILKADSYIYHNLNDTIDNIFTTTQTVFNQNRDDIDFRVNTDDYYGTLFIDGNDNTIILGNESFDSSPVASEVSGYGTDVKIYLSGSAGSKDSATRGVTLVAGDMVVSGTIYNGSGVAITGDITEIIAGTGLSGGGVSGNVTLSTNDAAIVHDNLSGFVSNEHIDHSTVSISGNNGITGGGDLTSNRTLSLDFSSLTDMTGDISGTTEFILQNGSTESRKAASEIKLSNFNNDSGWTTNTGTVTSVGLTEGNLIDISGGPITTSGNITVSVDLSELTPSTSDGDGDFFVVVDSANAQKKLTKANINLSGFNNDLSLLSLSNGVNNNIVTATGASGLNGESNLTFSGTLLTLNGFLTGSSGISIQNSKSNRNGINIHNSVSAPNVAFNTEFGADLRENAINGIGTDVGVLISGSAGGKDGVSKEVALVTGDMVISGTLYDGLGKSYIKDIEKGSFQTALASNQKQYLPGDDSSNEQSSIQYYSFVTAPFSGSFDKIILKAWSTTSFGQLSDLGGITASFHRGDNGSDPLNMSSSPSFTENIKVDLSSHPQNDYLEIVFSGSNFNPGDSYALALQPDNNWNAGGTLNLNYTIVTSYKLN